MTPSRYLERIRYHGPTEPTLDNLREIHRAHMLAVPFENLDIRLGHELSLSLPALFAKIVEGGRGGFCYALNGLFHWLLSELGYSVDMLGARVFGNGKLGPELDHMLLAVKLDNVIFADVGFGDSFLEPLPFDDREHEQNGRSYRLRETDDAWQLERRCDADWEPQYSFPLSTHRLEDYEDMCRYQQTSPESSFTRKSVCSIATPNGRITISNGRLIVTAHGKREERAIADQSELASLLHEYFGVRLAADTDLDRLLSSTGS